MISLDTLYIEKTMYPFYVHPYTHRFYTEARIYMYSRTDRESVFDFRSLKGREKVVAPSKYNIELAR